MKFCKACEGLNIDDLYSQASKSPSHTLLYTSYNLLESAASDGCNNCRTFQGRFNDQYGDLKGKLAQLEGSRATPVIVFLQTAFPENGKRPIIKLHVQIGDGPERPGVEPLRISFRVSQSWGETPILIIQIRSIYTNNFCKNPLRSRSELSSLSDT